MGRVGGVVITHGQLATELVNAAEMIVGEIGHITAVSIGWHDDVEVARETIRQAIARVNSGRGVLLLTDMFGGTPTNIAATFLGVEPVEIVTGVNLPMVLKLANQDPNDDLLTVARKVKEQGQKNIYLASEILTPTKR
jgi:PTS system mannose-specific IIA component